MVVPSFTGFAQKPDVAGAYLGGIRANQEDARIAQTGRLAREKIRSDEFQQQQQLQFAREKLAQDAQQAQLEFQAKMAAKEHDDLIKQQQLEMEKAYKEATIGLRQQQLHQAEQVAKARDAQAQQQLMSIDRYRSGQLGLGEGNLEARQREGDLREEGMGYQERNVLANEGRLKLSTEQASAKMLADQQYKKLFAQNKAQGMDDDEAAREAILAINPAMFGGAGSAAVRPPPGAIDTTVESTKEIEGRPARPEERFGGLFGIGQTVIPARPAIPGVPGVRTTHRAQARPAGRTNAVPAIPAVPAGVSGSGTRVSTMVDKIPSAAIEYLKKHPETADKFDQMYGEGASDYYLE